MCGNVEDKNMVMILIGKRNVMSVKYILVVLSLVVCACVYSSEKFNTFILKDNDNKNVYCYYVESGSCAPDICFLFSLIKEGIELRIDNLSYVLPYRETVSSNDTCAIAHFNSTMSLEKTPMTKETLRLLSLCLKETSEKFDLSNMRLLETYTYFMPEISIEYTNWLKFFSSTPQRPKFVDVIKAIEKTTLRRKINDVLRPYGVEVESFIPPYEYNKMLPPSKEEFMERHEIEKNTEIPDSIYTTWLTIKIHKIKD